MVELVMVMPISIYQKGHSKSVGFIGTFYYGLFQAYAGNYFGAVKSFLSSVNWEIKITNTQNGRVYMMRGFWYVGSYTQ